MRKSLLALGITAVITLSGTPAASAATPSFTIGSDSNQFVTVAVQGGSTAVGARLVAHDLLAQGNLTDGRNRWVKVPQSGGTFQLKNVKSQLCVQGGLIDPTLLVQAPCAATPGTLTMFYQQFRKIGIDNTRPALGRISRAAGQTWDIQNGIVVQGPIVPGRTSQTFILP